MRFYNSLVLATLQYNSETQNFTKANLKWSLAEELWQNGNHSCMAEKQCCPTCFCQHVEALRSKVRLTPTRNNCQHLPYAFFIHH